MKESQAKAEASGFKGVFRTANIRDKVNGIYDGERTSEKIGEVPKDTPYQLINFEGGYVVSLEENGDGTFRIKEIYDVKGIKVPAL